MGHDWSFTSFLSSSLIAYGLETRLELWISSEIFLQGYCVDSPCRIATGRFLILLPISAVTVEGGDESEFGFIHC